MTRRCFTSLQWSIVKTLSWTWPKVLGHTGSFDFQNIRSEFEGSPQIAKILSFLVRQQRLLSHCWVVNSFWVASQRQSACRLQFHYCSSTWSNNLVHFKRRTAPNYTMFCVYPVIFPDQVSGKKMMMWKILKQDLSLPGNFLLPFAELICEWNMHLHNCVYNSQCKVKLFRRKYYLPMAKAQKYSIWLIF